MTAKRAVGLLLTTSLVTAGAFAAATAAHASGPLSAAHTQPTSVSARTSANSVPFGGTSMLTAKFTSAGKPRSGSTVTLTGGGISKQLTADGSGSVSYAVKPTATSEYTLSVPADGTAAAASAKLQVKVGTVGTAISLRASHASVKPGKPSVLTAKVTSAGAARSGTPVRFYANGSQVAVVRTGANGTAALTVKPVKTTNYSASTDRSAQYVGAAANKAIAVTGRTAVTSTTSLTAASGGIITGHKTVLSTVVRAAGKPLANTAVRLADGSATVATARTNKTGAVSFTVKPVKTTTYIVTAAPSSVTAPAAKPSIRSYAAKRSVAMSSDPASTGTTGSADDATVTVTDPAPVNVNFSADVTDAVDPSTPVTITAAATTDGTPLRNADVTVSEFSTGDESQLETDGDGKISMDVAPSASEAYTATVAATDTTDTASAVSVVWVKSTPPPAPESVDFNGYVPGLRSPTVGVRIVLDHAVADDGSGTVSGYPAAATWTGHLADGDQPFDSSLIGSAPVTVNIPADQQLFFRQAVNEDTVHTWYSGDFGTKSLGLVLPGSDNYVPGAVLAAVGHVYGDASGITVDVADGANDGHYGADGTPVLYGLLPSVTGVSSDDPCMQQVHTVC